MRPPGPTSAEAASPSAERGAVLLALARGALDGRLRGGVEPSLLAPAAPADPSWLDEPAATFVTLRIEGRLRGCIGSLEPTRSLRDDVRVNAVHAALDNPRFPPVTSDELDSVRVEVSLLGPAEPVPAATEAAALAALAPGRDGVVLEHRGRRATFLPQVWEQLPERREFLRHLRLKAGLPRDLWDDDMRLYRYRVEKWRESDEEARR